MRNKNTMVLKQFQLEAFDGHKPLPKQPIVQNFYNCLYPAWCLYDMCKRGFAVIRCLSICLSTTVYCIQTAEDIVKLLCQPSSPIILVFRSSAPIPNS